MTCIKTGAHVFLEQYNEWAYGDVHEFDPAIARAADLAYDGYQLPCVYVLRVAQREFAQPIYPVKHFTFHRIEADWRDKPYGTILATSVSNHGYEGVPI